MFKIPTNCICIPITSNNPVKVCFSNKKYAITIQTHPTQIVKVYFLLKTRFLKIIGAQNQLAITLCSDLVCNKTLKASNSTLKQTNF